MRHPKPGPTDPIYLLLNDNRDRLPMFVIYDHPADYPKHFVARMWFTLPQEQCLNVVLRSPELESLQDLMATWGLTKLQRFGADDPAIVETWL
jgi:hypothetical protein